MESLHIAMEAGDKLDQPTNQQIKFKLTCQQIFIGSFRFQPSQKVIFCRNESLVIKLVAPKVDHPTERRVVIEITEEQLAKVVYHFSKELSVVFLYLVPSMGPLIRSWLGMSEKSEMGKPFYNPGERFNQKVRRIVLLVDGKPPNPQEGCKDTFPKGLIPDQKRDKVGLVEARELLKLSQELPEPEPSRTEEEGEEQLVVEIPSQFSQEVVGTGPLLIYPPGNGGISVNLVDYNSLAPDTYLNDIVIDFYLQYLWHELLNPKQRNRCHIFSTHFFKRLNDLSMNASPDTAEGKRSLAQRRHEGVRNWTKNVNLFEKDFIFIPINTGSHWFVAVVAYVRLSEREENKASGNVIQPCILIFDSMRSRSRVGQIRAIREYLEWEYWTKVGGEIKFDAKRVPGHQVAVPQQKNYTDCGLFLLEFVERFLIDRPITNFELPIRGLETWFDLDVATRKRAQIAELIGNLMKEYGYVGQLPNLF